ncbi:fimbrial protein [Klebsiella aerogenes]|uniref:fimbrial protein n=1 Tax=Klebsiella aerogenes TaxID=548 RepID=UPI001F2B6F13|nr:fimbrial protein [Klebsiella aerogenes]
MNIQTKMFIDPRSTSLFLHFLLLVVFLCVGPRAYAEAVYYRVESTNPAIVDFGTVTMSASNNQPGQYIDDSASDTGGHYTAVCVDNSGGDKGDLYQTSEYLYPVVGTSGSYTLVQLNEYLNAGIAYYYRKYHYFPSASSLIATNQPCSQSMDHSPVAYYARIQVRKPFIGNMDFNMVVGRQCQGSAGQECTRHTEAWQNVQIRGNIVVPQTCDIVPGSTFDVDLGQISQKAFVQGGTGNRPTGFTNRPLTVKVQCSGGVEANAIINVRLEGATASGHPQALASDNPDVGVVITKSDGSTVLVPNDLNSIIPMPLQDGQGSAVIQAYPVSLTGQAPAVGVFTTLANLRFDFS